MLSAAIFALSVLGQKRPAPAPNTNEELKPVFVFYKYMGGWSREKPQVSFVAWPNGEIIWRTPQAEFEVKGGTWGKIEVHYYRAHINPNRVGKEIAKRKKAGASKTAGWGYAFPDAQVFHRIVWIDGRRVDLGCSVMPPKALPGGNRGADWAKGRSVWFSLGAAREALTPKTRKEIPAPGNGDVQGWIGP